MARAKLDMKTHHFSNRRNSSFSRTEEVLCFGIERIYTHSKGGANELSDVAGFCWQTVAGFRWQTVAGFRWRTVGQVDAMTSRPTSLPARAEGELSDEMSGLERV